MRSIRLRAIVPTDDTALVYAHVTDFARYPKISPDVRFVAVTPAVAPGVAPAVTTGASPGVAPEASPGAPPGRPQHSEWEVNFRRGVMRWVERDDLDPAGLRVTFTQTDGDFADFHGTWQLAPAGAGCEVLFEVTYDFGIESLAGIMDPIAERVIKRAICAVLAEVTGEVTVVEGGAALTDLGELPAASGIRIVAGGN